MKIKVNDQKCTKCGLCVEACPVGAMTLSNRLKIEEPNCIGCRVCLATCKSHALSVR